MNQIKIYKDKDVEEGVLETKNIGIIGYGNQGKAQALNLKDFGLKVMIGLRAKSPRRKEAKSDGFRVCSINDLIIKSDVVCFMIPDEEIPNIFSDLLFRKGQSLLFSHGYAIHFKEVVPPKFVNIILVAPSGSGKMVREKFLENTGVPSLVAVEKNYTGDALEIALAYSKCIGSTRVGAFISSFSEETITDIFGEQTVLTGSIPSIIRESFNVLLEAGYSPEVSWLVCYYEVKSIIDSFHENGFDFLNNSISNLAEYGGATRGERLVGEKYKNEMKKILKEIEDGSFKSEWEEEKKRKYKFLHSKRNEIKNSKIEKITRQLLSLLYNNKNN